MPLAIAAESYAQMFMIINKIYNIIIKNKLRKNFDMNSSASGFSGLNSTDHCFAQLESIIWSWLIITATAVKRASAWNKELSSTNNIVKLKVVLQYH